MKKTLLLAIGAAVSLSSYAQNMKTTVSATKKSEMMSFNNLAAKGTAIGDTIILANSIHDTISIYTFQQNAGSVFGTNTYGIDAYAERYDWNTHDSSLKVLGVLTQFHGSVSPTTTKTVKMKLWAQGAPAGASPVKYNGFPAAGIDSTASISIKYLGATSDSEKVFLFPNPTVLSDTFFCGYTLNYSPTALNGDTIGLWSSQDGDRTASTYSIAGGDTTYNVKNALRMSGAWGDIYRVIGLKIDLCIFPIVEVGAPVSVKGMTKNDLTFFGSYPNPANNEANVKFALQNSADVTITVMDMSGRTIKAITQNKLSAGEHIVSIETTDLASGNYLYLLHTSKGDGIASKFTVAK